MDWHLLCTEQISLLVTIQNSREFIDGERLEQLLEPWNKMAFINGASQGDAAGHPDLDALVTLRDYLGFARNGDRLV